MRKQVLFLEDDRDDWSLVKDTLEEFEMEFPVVFFSNSTELLNHLKSSVKPSLILLDLNALPENGFEVLKKLKSDANWQDIPVVILTNSSNDDDKKEAYRLGASSYIKKPDTYEGTRNKISTFFKYWLEVVEV